MATPEQIKYANQVGYEHGYLRQFDNRQTGRMTIENTSQYQFKHNKKLSDAWQQGYTKYYQDVHNAQDYGSNLIKYQHGTDGPFASFYNASNNASNNTRYNTRYQARNNARGKKSKRLSGQKKRRTQKKRSLVRK
jgi:hypothetical protein